MKKLIKQLAFIVIGLAVIASGVWIVIAGSGSDGGSGVNCSQDPADCVNYGLVGYWDFEEGAGTSATDMSKSQNTGTLVNMATGTPWTTGITPFSGGRAGGTALSFDGVDDYVNAGNDSSLNPSSAITVEAWVNMNDKTSFQEIVHRGGSFSIGANQGPYSMGIYNNLTYWDIGDGTTRSTFSLDISSLSLNTWYHFVGIFDGTNQDFYINGVQYPHTPTVTFMRTDTNNVLMGGSGRDFNGLIDDVRIYNRALSPEEIRYHYNRGGPVGHWKFDEGSGGTAYDDSSNNYDAALKNIATSTDWVSGKFGSAFNFNGTDSWVDVGTCYDGVKTISFWTKPKTSTEYFLDLNGSAYVSASAGVVSAAGFTSPTIYVNGSTRSDLVADQWSHIAITTDTGLNASDFDIGRIEGVGYMQGAIDDVKIYNYARTPAQILQDYNAGKSVHFK